MRLRYLGIWHRLEKAYFTLVNEDGEELESWAYMELAKEAGDIVKIQIPALDAKQSLLYHVSDSAKASFLRLFFVIY